MNYNPKLEAYREELRKRAEYLESGKRTTEDLGHQLNKMGVPGRPLAALEKNLRATNAITLAKEFMSNSAALTTWLVLLGVKGKGKSVAAAWAMRRHVERAGLNNAPTGAVTSPALWVQASKLTSVSNREAVDAQWLDELRLVGFLVLDDIGDEASAVGREALANLALERYARHRRTVLTSNLTRAAIGSRYGAAFADRLNEGSIVGELAGESMRGQNPGVKP